METQLTTDIKKAVNGIETKVLCFLGENQPKTSAQLVKYNRLSYAELLPCLERLLDKGLIARVESGWELIGDFQIGGVGHGE